MGLGKALLVNERASSSLTADFYNNIICLPVMGNIMHYYSQDMIRKILT